MAIAITPFEPADEAWLRSLLTKAKLATSDLTTEMLGNFLVAREGQTRVGVAGIECHGPLGLLRSVAVETTGRGQGIGSRLVDAIEVRAREQGIEVLYLLTETARDFFGRLGYRPLAGQDAPATIRATREFDELCPKSCACMAKSLGRRTHHVLFLCTGNSARSILAEAILNHLEAETRRFRAFSAGSHPQPHIHPLTLETLHENGLPTEGLRTKRLDEFTKLGAPCIDYVITLCDQARAEPCPLWLNQPAAAHWGLPDPASVTGTEATRRQAFGEIFRTLHRKIGLFVALPFDALDPSVRTVRIREIGQL